MKFSNPSFCIITPTAYLEPFATKSKTHLVLAHLVDKDEKYANFYKMRRESGDFIIMDCSSYEMLTPYAPDKLVELGTYCGANAIVLPDYPFQPSQKTVDTAKQFIPQFKQAGFLTAFVPQSEKGNLKDWMNGYVWASNNTDVDILCYSILGVPNALPHINPTYARVVMASLLREQGLFADHKHNHCLGLNSGPNLEIPSLLKMNALDTLDSSNPCWVGILGHEYTSNSDSFLSVSKPTVPVDFNIPLTKNVETLNRINHNIDMTLKLFKKNQTDKVWYAVE